MSSLTRHHQPRHFISIAGSRVTAGLSVMPSRCHRGRERELEPRQLTAGRMQNSTSLRFRLPPLFQLWTARCARQCRHHGRFRGFAVARGFRVSWPYCMIGPSTSRPPHLSCSALHPAPAPCRYPTPTCPCVVWEDGVGAQPGWMMGIAMLNRLEGGMIPTRNRLMTTSGLGKATDLRVT